MSDDDSAIEDGESGQGAALRDVLPPRENPALFGHHAAEAAFLGAFNAGRLPHAWLIAGPRGIGKATLAFRIARFLLAQGAGESGPSLFGGAATPITSLAIPPESPPFRLVASGGHPDLLLVERGWDQRKKKLRSEIVVDDTRAIAGFLHLTPSQGAWRIVILDGADDMNRNAANAVLKVLEEPPKRAVLLLTSESPGRLLATIRSRCRRLNLKKLSQDIVLETISKAVPELNAADAQTLAQLAEGSIGRGLALAAADGLDIHRGLYKLLGEMPKPRAESLHRFADSLIRGEAEGYRLMSELLPAAVARLAVLALGRERDTDPAERAALARLAARRRPDQWVEVWRKICHLFAAADAVDLDKKAVVLNAFFAVEEAAR